MMKEVSRQCGKLAEMGAEKVSVARNRFIVSHMRDPSNTTSLLTSLNSIAHAGNLREAVVTYHASYQASYFASYHASYHTYLGLSIISNPRMNHPKYVIECDQTL